MKIFISWSGERSRELACIFKELLPVIIQSVEPWMSEIDLDAGKRWSEDIATHLESSQFGIVCVTPENQASPWLNFEAGALSKKLNVGRVCPCLLKLGKSDLSGPLSQFQSVILNKEDIKKLIDSINTSQEKPILDKNVLNKCFDKWWPEFNEKIIALPSATVPVIPRSEKDMIEEVLELVRAQHRLLNNINLQTTKNTFYVPSTQSSGVSGSYPYNEQNFYSSFGGVNKTLDLTGKYIPIKKECAYCHTELEYDASQDKFYCRNCSPK